MNKQTLINDLLTHFPELEPTYRKEIDWWHGELPGFHNLVGDVLNPYVLEKLRDNDKAMLYRIFSFFEIMATCGDNDIVNVLIVTVLEEIGDYKELLYLARDYMGEKTREYSDYIENFWGRYAE